MPIARLLLSLGSFSRADLPARRGVNRILSHGLRLAVDRSRPLRDTGRPLDSSEAGRRHRAFFVEDEILIALDLEAEMNALGFNFCRLAPRANKACPLAMSDHPDIVLMDFYDAGSANV